jgi:polyisoprenyl-teichoic acid--peptidoglycan teichoic acid transferase
MAQTGGPQQNYSQWDAPTQPPRLPADAIPPPPLAPESTSPLPGAARPISTPRRKAPTTRRFARGGIGRRVLLLLLLAGLLITGLLAHRFWDFGSTISTQNPLSTQTRYMTAGDRVNLLIMGYGGGQHNGANLTDSMIVVSINPKDNATTMISVPRDLWVQVPPQSGNYAKLNTAYQDGLENGYNGISASPAAGGAEAARKVADVTGMPVHSWLTINFDGFRALVDALGGVDINVPVGWTAINLGGDGLPGGRTATFKAGLQHMDGERALQYARARYIASPASEGSDFARSRRQLLLIHAIIDRARSLGAMPGLLGAMNAMQQTIYTNLSLTDLTLLAAKADINHAALIGLTNQNVLVDGVTDDGQDILEPANGDWGVIKQYISDHLKQ